VVRPLHHNKELSGRGRQLRDVFAAHGEVKSVLRLGCGTARHLELLAAGGSVGAWTGPPVMVAQAGNGWPPWPRGRRSPEADLLRVQLEPPVRRRDHVFFRARLLVTTP